MRGATVLFAGILRQTAEENATNQGQVAYLPAPARITMGMGYGGHGGG